MSKLPDAKIPLSALLAWAAGSAIQVSAQEAGPPSAPISDPHLVALHFQQVTARPEFQNATDSDVNSQLRDWLSQWFVHLGSKFEEFKYASNIPGIASLFFTLFVLFILAALLYVGIRLSRRQEKWIDDSPGTPAAASILRPPEFYDEEIRQAVTRADWHAAWLSTWRQFLSRMERSKLVEADRTRTNHEYLTQLQARPLPASAASLLLDMIDAYDRFIYGRKEITETDWVMFREQVKESALLLHLDNEMRSRGMA